MREIVLTFRTKLLFSIAVLMMLVPFQASGETVFIDADGEIGQGITYAQCSQCLIITPAHVAGLESDNIRIIGKNNDKTEGEVAIDFTRDKFFQMDLAILRVQNEEFCSPPEEWPSGEGLGEVLEKKYKAVLERRPENSNLIRIKVDIKDHNERYIYVKPEDDEPRLVQGWSGATLKIEGIVSGMVVAILDKEGQEGIGQVIRQDFLTDQIKRFIRACITPTSQSLDSIAFLTGWYSRKALLPETEQKERVYAQIDGYLESLGISMDESSQYYLSEPTADGGERAQLFTESVYGKLQAKYGAPVALFFAVATNIALLAAEEQSLQNMGQEVPAQVYQQASEMAQYLDLPSHLAEPPKSDLIHWLNDLGEYFEKQLPLTQDVLFNRCVAFLAGWYSRKALLPETEQKERVYAQIDGYLESLGISMDESSRYYLSEPTADGGERAQLFTESVYGKLQAKYGDPVARYFVVPANIALLAAEEQSLQKMGQEVPAQIYQRASEMAQYLDLPSHLAEPPKSGLIHWFNDLVEYFEEQFLLLSE